MPPEKSRTQRIAPLIKEALAGKGKWKREAEMARKNRVRRLYTEGKYTKKEGIQIDLDSSFLLFRLWFSLRSLPST